jgi:hypothetical protein
MATNRRLTFGFSVRTRWTAVGHLPYGNIAGGGEYQIGRSGIAQVGPDRESVP